MSATNIDILLESFLDANYYEGYTAYIKEHEPSTYQEHYNFFIIQMGLV